MNKNKYIKEFSRIKTNKLLTDATQVFNNHETSKIWNVIKNIINSQKKDSHFPNRLDVDQKSYTKPIDILNKLNIRFSNIGKQTSKKR